MCFFKAWLTSLQQKRGKTFLCADSTDLSRIDSEFCSVSITLDVCIKKIIRRQGVVTLACNPSTPEAETQVEAAWIT